MLNLEEFKRTQQYIDLRTKTKEYENLVIRSLVSALNVNNICVTLKEAQTAIDRYKNS